MTNTKPSTSLISCVESCLNPALPIGTLLASDATSPALHLIPSSTLAKLKTLGPSRVKDMRALGQSTQIVSHVPIAATLATCSKLNDALHAAIQLNMDRFAALAMLPADGLEASRELQRCVTKMKFVGGIIGLKSGVESAGLLDRAYDSLWTTAERYRVPIMLRETWPTGAELATYQGELADAVLAPLATLLHASHSHSPIPIIHLYLSSVFDRHPNLRLILAHPGSLPSLLPRIETILAHIPTINKPKRSFLDVWQHNLYVTTADALDLSTMRTLLEQIPIDRILYASNYPLEQRGKELMEELKETGFLTKDEWERVAWGNAEFLFGLRTNTIKSTGARGA